MAKKADDEKVAAPVWIRHRDTGGVRRVPAADWHKDEAALRAEGYAPCAEDGTPVEE
jgi:hypothetical protein